ncbi:MAG TPA: hydrogenase formation protein HypD [Trueperaceae bacterium]|nr:hydrogenase formation protein HypD [Trueperaceae bacterium]
MSDERRREPPGELRGDAYRDPGLVAALAGRVRAAASELGRPLKLMHICGTHEHALGRYALRDLLPPELSLLAGPGCPVCVCDSALIDAAVRLALRPGVVVASFGDMLAVPGSLPLRGEGKGDVRMSLESARAQGGEVRAVTSVFEAGRLAAENPESEVVFFSVGFETTVVATAALLRRDPPPNLSILEANYYTPPATAMLPSLPGFDVDGLLLPGHATAVTGTGVYDGLPALGISCAVAGFEPADILAAVSAVLRQLLEGRPRIDNAYPRVVSRQGNPRALAELAEVFEAAPRRWRGIADIDASGFDLRPAYRQRSARARFPDAFTAEGASAREHPAGCRCAEVTLGQVTPDACALFGGRCTPDNPYGPCMVSHEGTCRAWQQYGMARGRIAVRTA